MEVSLKRYTAEYGGFKLRIDGDYCTVLLDAEPLITFDNEPDVRHFIDTVNDALDRFVYPPIRLHFTGCSRCRKTATGVKHNPCRTGIPLFQATKVNTISIVKAHATAVKEAKAAAANVSPS